MLCGKRLRFATCEMRADFSCAGTGLAQWCFGCSLVDLGRFDDERNARLL